MGFTELLVMRYRIRLIAKDSKRFLGFPWFNIEVLTPVPVSYRLRGLNFQKDLKHMIVQWRWTLHESCVD